MISLSHRSTQMKHRFPKRAKPEISRRSFFLCVSSVFYLGLFIFLAVAHAGPGIVDDSASPHAVIRSVGLNEVHWTHGFWAEREELGRRTMIPAMGALMEGTNYTQFFQNFRIAAGLAQGRARGASFNDGDFYKWIEAASATLASGDNPELRRTLDEIIAVIGQAQRDDGYLHTPVLIRRRNGDTNAVPFREANNFEMYNMGHLLTAACVHYRVTGETNFLAIARKAADFLYETLDRK